MSKEIIALFKNKELNSNKKGLIVAREPYRLALSYRKKCEFLMTEILGINNFEILSDFPKKTDFYIDLKSIQTNSITYEDYILIENLLDIGSIIKNERVFRYTFSYVQSLDLILKCAKYFIDFFKKNNYDVIVINVIDNYILDILSIISKHYKIPIVSICGNSFDKNYMTVTQSGELNQIREPEEKEKETFYTNIVNKSKQPFNLNKGKVYKQFVRNYCAYKYKYFFHHLIRYKLFGQLNYMYISTTSVAYPKSIYTFLRSHFIFNNLNNIKISKEKSVYIPLHYHPETTTEYFIHNKKFLSYYPSLYKVISYFSDRGYSVLVKEHTSMLFKRPMDVYKTIKSFKNTHLISAFENTYDVLDQVELTALWTGTTGVEAILNNHKVVLTETDVYYNINKNLTYVGQEDKAKKFSSSQKDELISSILSGFVIIKP